MLSDPEWTVISVFVQARSVRAQYNHVDVRGACNIHCTTQRSVLVFAIPPQRNLDIVCLRNAGVTALYHPETTFLFLPGISLGCGSA